MEEIWKNIEGFENVYQVSNYGRVKRNKGRYSKVDKIRKIQVKKNGYAVVMLSINQKHKLCHIHRLVAKAFIENNQNLPQVNHKDLNKLNNHVDNLEWVTPLENMRHALKNKKWSNNSKSGIEHPTRVEVVAYDLKGNKIKEFISITEASKYTKSSQSSISSCLSGRRKSSNGFQFAKKCDTDINKYKRERDRAVGKYSIDGGFFRKI
jgi:hypothetical protein